MIERITQSMLAATTTYASQKSLNRLVGLNQQMSSGKRMQFASDDPASSVDSMRLRKQLAATEQYQRNIDDANNWMSTLDSAMQSVDDKYTLVKTKLIEANSGVQGKESLEAIAAELRQQATGIMSLTNTTYLGRTVFSGNSDKGQVFTVNADADGKVLGFMQTDTDSVSGSPVTRQINANHQVKVNVDGNKVFGTGSFSFNTDGTIKDNNPNVMNALVKAAELLEAKGQLTNAPSDATVPVGDENLTMAQIDKRLYSIQNFMDNKASQLRTEQSTLGAAHSVVMTAQDTITGDLMNVQSQISNIEDVDVQKLTIDYSLADMAYKSSLNATSRVVQPSLLDYLR